jgi:hypothetical protein
MPKKLIVQDTSDYIGRWQASGGSDEHNAIMLRVESEKDLVDGLNGLIKQGMKFDTVLFRTHGDTGQISFGDDYVYDWYWPRLADKINFPAISGSSKNRI